MHLSGALVGVFMAFSCRSVDTVKVKKYSWEEESAAEDVPAWYIEAMNADQDAVAEEQTGEK